MPEVKAGKMRPGAVADLRIHRHPAGRRGERPEHAAERHPTVAYYWMAEEASGGEEWRRSAGRNSGRRDRHPGKPRYDGPAPKRGGGTQGGAGVMGVVAVLGLTVPKIGQTPSGGSLLTYVNCDASCRIFVRGRLRASAHGHHRTARIRFSMKRPYTAGAKRMRIPIPRGLRKWLRRMPPPKRLRAKLTFVAVGTAGGREVVKKKVRLRVRHHR